MRKCLEKGGIDRKEIITLQRWLKRKGGGRDGKKCRFCTKLLKSTSAQCSVQTALCHKTTEKECYIKYV